ncbi:MAG: hypothetical protein WBC44_09795 [Planctomycetaceae bacterium]
MRSERFPSSVKRWLCFVVVVSLYLTVAMLWLPVEGHGRPQAEGGYKVTLDLGLLRFGDVTWLSSPTRFTFDFSTNGVLRPLLTIGATSLLLWLCRSMPGWCGFSCRMRTVGRQTPAVDAASASATTPST